MFRVIPAIKLSWITLLAIEATCFLPKGVECYPANVGCIVGEGARGEGVNNNLMVKYVDMGDRSEDDERYGKVWNGDRWELCKVCRLKED